MGSEPTQQLDNIGGGGVRTGIGPAVSLVSGTVGPARAATTDVPALQAVLRVSRAVLGAQHFNEAHEVIAEQSLVALGAASLSIRPRGLRPTRLRAVDSECDDDGPRP
jgi:hypothetical protein